jgi:prepilin-type N-terminal cleavage/methylation domain-containing protein
VIGDFRNAIDGVSSSFQPNEDASLKYRYCFNTAIILPVNADGFTLLELIIVIGILGTLAGIGVPTLTSFREKTKVTQAKRDIKSI